MSEKFLFPDLNVMISVRCVCVHGQWTLRAQSCKHTTTLIEKHGTTTIQNDVGNADATKNHLTTSGNRSRDAPKK